MLAAEQRVRARTVTSSAGIPAHACSAARQRRWSSWIRASEIPKWWAISWSSVASTASREAAHRAAGRTSGPRNSVILLGHGGVVGAPARPRDALVQAVEPSGAYARELGRVSARPRRRSRPSRAAPRTRPAATRSSARSPGRTGRRARPAPRPSSSASSPSSLAGTSGRSIGRNVPSGSRWIGRTSVIACAVDWPVHVRVALVAVIPPWGGDPATGDREHQERPRVVAVVAVRDLDQIDHPVGQVDEALVVEGCRPEGSSAGAATHAATGHEVIGDRVRWVGHRGSVGERVARGPPPPTRLTDVGVELRDTRLVDTAAEARKT